MSYYTLEILKKGQSAMEFLTASGNIRIITAIKNLNDYQILILKTNSKVEKKMIAYVGKDMKPFILDVEGRKKIVYPVRNDLKKSGNEETRKICENDIKKRNGGKISKARLEEFGYFSAKFVIMNYDDS